MSEENIQNLLKEIRDNADVNAIYKAVLGKIDLYEMADTNISIKEILANFAYAGFMFGVEHALRNIDIHEE